MKLKGVATTQGGLKQFTLRLNEKELDSIYAAIELSRALLPKAPNHTDLKALRHKVDNAKRELSKAKKELENEN